MTTQTRTRRYSAPSAVLVGIKGHNVRILCPYCQRQHSHALSPGARRGEWERFAPACGLERTPNQRETGYRFRTTPAA